MQDPFDNPSNASGGMSLGAFLILVVLVMAGLYLLSEADWPAYNPGPSPTTNVSPR